MDTPDDKKQLSHVLYAENIGMINTSMVIVLTSVCREHSSCIVKNPVKTTLDEHFSLHTLQPNCRTLPGSYSFIAPPFP